MRTKSIYLIAIGCCSLRIVLISVSYIVRVIPVIIQIFWLLWLIMKPITMTKNIHGMFTWKPSGATFLGTFFIGTTLVFQNNYYNFRYIMFSEISSINWNRYFCKKANGSKYHFLKFEKWAEKRTSFFQNIMSPPFFSLKLGVIQCRKTCFALNNMCHSLQGKNWIKSNFLLISYLFPVTLYSGLLVSHI